MVLQLADHSTRLPRRMVRGVLIKVGEFIFWVDFIGLEIKDVMSPENEIPVILSQLFLATSNALINCRDRKTKLTFENMTMELNVFNLQKQPMGFDDVEHHILNWVGDFSLGEQSFIMKRS